MDSTKVKRNNSGFRGSVLFTVLAVMMVMLILVLTTITLAGIASKKAYSTWFDNQTNYTAQSLVDNVVRSFQPGSTNTDAVLMGQEIIDSIPNKGDEVELDVTVNSGGTITSDIAGYGTVQRMTFKNVGTTNEFHMGGITPGAGVTSEQLNIIKVTATVTMGNETSTYSTYVTGSNGSGGGHASPGGFIAKGQNFGGSGTNDAPSTYGRVYVGINGDTETPIFDSTFANQSASAGDLYYNVKKLVVNASTSGPLMFFGRNDPESEYYSGLKVSGQLEFNGGNVIKSLYQPISSDMSQDCINNFPYIYAKEIVLAGDGAKISVEDGPLNVFCDKITNSSTGTGSKFGGNINLICLAEGQDNVMPYDGSSLTRWASALTSSEPNYDKTQTGNVYCKGNFTTKGNGGTIDGDLLVLGNLKITNPMTVKGIVCYGGSIDGEDKLNAAGGVHSIGTTDFTDFCSACDVLKADSGSRFKDIVVTKKSINGSATELEMFQTFQHLKESYFESDGTTYKGTINQSSLSPSDANNWHGEETIDTGSNKYYLWGYDDLSVSNLSQSSYKRIDIDPGNSEMWINISNKVNYIRNKVIVVDDSAGGSVRFFIDKNRTSELLLDNTYIVTQKYADMLLNIGGGSVSVKPGATLNVETYPSSDLVPHIFIYAGAGNNVRIHMQNNGLITGDLVGPDGTFESDANCNVKVNLEYKLLTYDTVNNVVNYGNSFTITEHNKPVRVIGSIEFDNQDNTNGFGYIYVDDPPNGGGPGFSGGEYKWNIEDGYSSY